MPVASLHTLADCRSITLRGGMVAHGRALETSETTALTEQFKSLYRRDGMFTSGVISATRAAMSQTTSRSGTAIFGRRSALVRQTARIISLQASPPQSRGFSLVDTS